MTLNIKNPHTHELARELAELTGETMTEAVTTAVRERLQRVRQAGAHTRVRAEALLAIGRDVAQRLPEHVRDLDHSDLLYDERGLPR